MLNLALAIILASQAIDVLGPKPSNICFGGPDGRTAYVTEVEQTRLVQFRVDKPGLAWIRWPWPEVSENVDCRFNPFHISTSATGHAQAMTPQESNT